MASEASQQEGSGSEFMGVMGVISADFHKVYSVMVLTADFWIHSGFPCFLFLWRNFNCN